jgi:large subunit ribosomal protein L29
MDAEKLRNLTDSELQHQQRELNDQLFKLKFQLKMGQTESLNKIRGLRKDVARIHTIMREKQLNIVHPTHVAAAPASETAAAETEAAEPKKAAPAKAAGKKAKAAKPAAKTRKK